MSHQSNIRRLIFASMMAAVVYVASAFLQLSIPTAIGTTEYIWVTSCVYYPVCCWVRFMVE